MMLVTFLPLLGKIFGFLVFFDKEATEYFFNIIKEQIGKRAKRKGQKEKRNDMIDLLTEALIGQSAKDEGVKLQVEFSSAWWIESLILSHCKIILPTYKYSQFRIHGPRFSTEKMTK